MPLFTHKLAAYLVKEYGMNLSNAHIIIDEEWDFIEEQMVLGEEMQGVADALVDIYMVA